MTTTAQSALPGDESLKPFTQRRGLRGGGFHPANSALTHEIVGEAALGSRPGGKPALGRDPRALMRRLADRKRPAAKAAEGDRKMTAIAQDKAHAFAGQMVGVINSASLAFMLAIGHAARAVGG